MRAGCAPAWVRRAGGDSCGEHADSAIACTGWYAGTLRADSACHGLHVRASRMRTSRAHAPFITRGRWNDHPWRSVCGAPTLICIVIVALNVGSAAGSILTGHCGRRTRYPHRGSPGMWITRRCRVTYTAADYLSRTIPKQRRFFHEIKKRPTRGGSLFQVQRSRISAQPHRCNGKSFQCPPNVIILLIIYFCGSALRLSLYLQLCSEFRITQIEIAHASQSEYMCSFYLSVFISTKNLTEKIAYSVRFSRLDVQSLKYSGNTSACRSLFAENLTFPRTYEARECIMVFCCAKGKPQYPTISRADLNAP